MSTHTACLAILVIALLGPSAQAQVDTTNSATLRFAVSDSSAYRFATGVVEGLLRAGGESLGISDVRFTPTGQPISRVYGWLNHYRVFSDGVRYGRGMRHLPSQERQHADGSVSTVWPAGEDRPFHMQAVYRWSEPHILDVETVVESVAHLPGFEVFLASYFPDTFTEVRIPVMTAETPSRIRWLDAREEDGYRQAFLRDEAALALIHDGRWQLAPDPIEWTLQSERAWPMSLRRDPATGVTVVFMTEPEETFAIYTPHATQRHYALYYSMFGRDLTPGETVSARARAVVLMDPDEDALLREAEAFFGTVPPDGYQGTTHERATDGCAPRAPRPRDGGHHSNTACL
jgi:hypothetical protein